MSRLASAWKRKQLLIIFVVFSLLDFALWCICRDLIPRRDIIACGVGLISLEFVLRFPHDRRKLPTTKEFNYHFALLSSLEVLLTIVIPWFLILSEFYQENNFKVSLSLFAPHLFVFQAQIALESLVMDEGSWALFYYTCLSNTYRATPLLIGLSRSNVEDLAGFSIGHCILAMAVILWMWSTCFIVFIWYPLLPGVTRKQKATNLQE